MVSRSYKSSLELFKRIEGCLPYFVDVFDEESFYLFAGLVVIVTILAAFILSKFIVIKEYE